MRLCTVLMQPTRRVQVLSPTGYNFNFVYFLTLLHTLVTLGGMLLFSYFGLFKRKAVPVVQVLLLLLLCLAQRVIWALLTALLQVLPLAAAFCGYIVLWCSHWPASAAADAAAALTHSACVHRNVCLRVNSVVFYQLSKARSCQATA